MSALGRFVRAAGLWAAACGVAIGQPGAVGVRDGGRQPSGRGGYMPQPPAGAPEAPSRSFSMAAAAGQQLARAALVDLRLVPDPTPADARLAELILKDAAALDGGRPFIARFALDAATMAGDQSAVMETARRLVSQDPADTWSQLEFVQARLAMCQTVEERLALLEGLLGPKGDSLDAGVRSRLALQSATLRRERGDVAGFNKDLTQAVALDPSNYAAAALALDLFTLRVNDPAGRFELLVNALQAAPLDPTVHAQVAHELAAAGAAEQSARFYDNARRLYARRGRFLPLEQNAGSLVQTWKLKGPEVVIKPLNDSLEAERRKAQIDLDVANATGKPVDALPSPASFRHPAPIERVRFMAALAAGDRSTVDRSLVDYRATLAELPTNDPAGGAGGAELAFFRAMADAGDIRTDVSRLRTTAGVTPEMLARLDAWVKYRTGNKAGGRADFEGMKNDLLGALAVAAIDLEAAPAPGTPAARALDERLAALAAMAPASPVSAWAVTKYAARNDGRAPAPTPVAEKFLAMGAGVPAWLDDAARDPARAVSIKVDPARPGGFGPLDPAVVTFRVTNNTPVPLAVGPGATVDNRLAISFSVDMGGNHMSDTPDPEVSGLYGRVRIMPREEATFAVWADPGISGWAIQNHLMKTARIRVTLVQGFVLDNGVKPGLFGNQFDPPPLSRSSVPSAEPGRLAAEIATLADEEFAVAVLQARQLLLPRDRPVTLEQAKALVNALGERYRRSGSAERVLILTLTPTPRLCGSAIDLERVAASVDEKDPAVARAALLTRVDDPQSLLLAKFKEHPDAGVREVARLIDARLGTDRPTFANLVFKTQAPSEKDKGKPAGKQAGRPGAAPAKPGDPAVNPSDRPGDNPVEKPAERPAVQPAPGEPAPRR